jgi:hypothetical protein
MRVFLGDVSNTFYDPVKGRAIIIALMNSNTQTPFMMGSASTSITKMLMA